MVFRAPSGEERIVLAEPVLLCRTCPTILIDPPRIDALGVAGWKLVSVVANDRWYRDGR